ncbi:MAG TPA: penicillin acylase family protein [Candidatus Polarisedimenticolaceae bacterium]|nr:penicillin acylase family protein [Candidatus Polarisedimenticolaceae bacterium]
MRGAHNDRCLRLLACGLLAGAIRSPGLAAGAAAPPTSRQLAASVVIHRDTYGVPHVFGRSDASCVFGFLYAQAEDHFAEIEDNYAAAIGRAAELRGPRALTGDAWNRLFEITSLSRAEYAAAAPQMRALYDAAAAGLNFYLDTHPQVRPRLFERFEPWHVVAFARYAVFQLFVSDVGGVPPDQVFSGLQATPPHPPPGSNGWAIAPARSVGGRAMLFINPHVGFFGPTAFYEGHLRSDAGWNISGGSLIGLPFPVLGHNARLGWTHTVNLPDIVDLYAERFDDPAAPLAYRYGAAHRTATQWTETIQVRGAAAAESRSFTFRKTHHGPIIRGPDGQALAVRIAKLAEGGQLEQWYRMGRARSLREFEAALSALAVPMFNTIYADAAGNILYVYAGALPRRDAALDWDQPVDGADPATEWRGYHSLAELPRVLNPPHGFIQNCNSSPFATSDAGNPDPAAFPSYMVHDDDNARARLSRRILAATPRFDLDAWSRAACDTSVFEAERLLPELAAEWRRLEGEDPARAARTAAAIATLERWNRISTTASEAMTLFAGWFSRLDSAAADSPSWPRVSALEGAIDELTASGGSWRVPWGEVNRLQRRRLTEGEDFSDAEPSLGFAGAPGELGIIANFYTRAATGQARNYGIAGNSFVEVVEFGEQVAARSVLVFGESGDPSSPHYFDQAPLYAARSFKPAWFSRADVRAHRERSYHPGE